MNTTTQDPYTRAISYINAVNHSIRGTAHITLDRIEEDGTLDAIIWADAPDHAHEITRTIIRELPHPDLWVYTLPTILVAGDWERIPEHCAPGPRGRIVVGLG